MDWDAHKRWTDEVTRRHESLRKKLRPFIDVVVPALERWGVTGFPSQVEVWDAEDAATKTHHLYNECGGYEGSWEPTQRERDDHAALQAARERGRHIGNPKKPGTEWYDSTEKDLIARTIVDLVFHHATIHKAYPGHEACENGPPLGDDMLPACLTDKDIDMFMCRTVLDPQTVRAILRQLVLALPAGETIDPDVAWLTDRTENQ